MWLSFQDPEYQPIDNWLTSVLSHPVELTDEFKRHYEVWLQQEVFQASIDWDQLVASQLIWFDSVIFNPLLPFSYSDQPFPNRAISR